MTFKLSLHHQKNQGGGSNCNLARTSLFPQLICYASSKCSPDMFLRAHNLLCCLSSCYPKDAVGRYSCGVATVSSVRTSVTNEVRWWQVTQGAAQPTARVLVQASYVRYWLRLLTCTLLYGVA
jgi:hypothetical protein